MTETGTAAGRKRSAHSAAAKAIPLEHLADFAEIAAPPAAGEMWPVHPVLWIEPRLAPAIPASSGLRIDRHYRIPAPGFLYPAAEAAWPLSKPVDAGEPVAPPWKPSLPESGLVPLGWDPRVAAAGRPPKGENR